MTIGVSAAMPMLCAGGARCPNQRCPFNIDKHWPLGEPCPIESNLIQVWTKSYVEDIGIDPSHITEMILVNKLVESDIIDYRANLGLSGGKDEEAQTLLKTTIIEGDKSTSESVGIHPLLEAKERAHRDRLKTLESLAVTRREKYKRAAALKKGEDSDVSKHLSTLNKTIEQFKKSSHKAIEDIKEEASLQEKEDTYYGIEEADWEAKE